MENCWICGNIADSEEHKFKASDIKKFHGKKIDAYYVSGESIKINSYKDKILKFPKVICINCNNSLSRPHDDAYDKFVAFCHKNYTKILEFPVINFEEIYGLTWEQEKANLYRYYAKHAGCKIVTSNIKTDTNNLARFIKGDNEIKDFTIMFEQKDGVRAIMNALNLSSKYNHLYNSDILNWNNHVSPKFGGWLTNNYLTTNWVFGKDINSNSKNILKNKYEVVMLSDTHFFEIDNEDKCDLEFSRLKFINQYIVGFENGYKKDFETKVEFFEKIIEINNSN